MPTWALWFIPVLVVFVILAFVMSPPEALATWFVNKYELHPQLKEDTDVTVDGSPVDQSKKKEVLDAFNKAVFIERYYQTFPVYSGSPIVLDTRSGKQEARYFVYAYADHVDVFKQRKKKVVAYRVLSEILQSKFASASGSETLQA